MKRFALFLITFLACFIAICQSQKDEYSTLVEYLNKKEIRIISYIGDTTEFSKKENKIYISDYFINLNEFDESWFMPNNSHEFDSLNINYLDILLQYDSLLEKKIPLEISKNLEMKKTRYKGLANNIFSMTPFFKINDSKYCIIFIKNSIRKEEWVIYIKEKNGEIVKDEIYLWLD